MTDQKIFEIFRVPLRTLQLWKNANKDNWRYILYMYMKNHQER